MCVRLERDNPHRRNEKGVVDDESAGDLGGVRCLGGGAPGGGTLVEEDADVDADVRESPTAAAGECVEGGAATHEAISSGDAIIRGPRVQLDLWHVLDRLVGPAHVANGGYGPLEP